MSAPLDAAKSKPLEGGPSFPLRHRLLRVMWNVTWLLLASWTPPFLHPWRRFLLRLFGARIAPKAVIHSSVRVWYPPNLEVGRLAALAPNVICYCMDQITVGDNAVVSQGAHLCGGTHDLDDPYFQLQTGAIVVGAKAWIAAEAFVGPGVTIGEGAVLGARAVTVKDLEPWMVYVGNPARAIRERRRSLGNASGVERGVASEWK